MTLPTWETVEKISKAWSDGKSAEGTALGMDSINQILASYPESDGLPDDIMAILSVLSLQAGIPKSEILLSESPTFANYLNSGDIPVDWRNQLEMRINFYNHAEQFEQLDQLTANSLLHNFWLGKGEISDAILAIIHTQSSSISWWVEEGEFRSENLARYFSTSFLLESEDVRSNQMPIAFEKTIEILNSFVTWPAAQEFGEEVESSFSN
jgi:hypothetical protein